METTTRLILPDVAEALRVDPSSVVELAEELHPADLAELCMQLDDELAIKLVKLLPVETAAQLLEALDHGRRVQLFGELAHKEAGRAADLAEEMSPDERVDVLGELEEETRTQILRQMEQEEAREVRQLLSYPEGTAGALMTTNFVALPVDATVAAAIEQVRKSAEDMETIYDAYAVDPNGTLLGVVSLRDLIVAKGDRRIADLMTPNVVAVDVTLDQEEVARVIAKYDLFAVPVIDHNRRVIGIVTVDDVIDVIKEEATEDVQRLGAVEPLEDTYFQTGFWTFVQKRASWLIVLFLGELVTGTAMKHYTGAEEAGGALSAMNALMWFIPLIISSGGNAGSQSASLMIRALAVGEVRPRDFGRVVARELAIGVALGTTLAFVGMGRVLLWEATRTVEMTLTVSLAIVAVVTIGAVAGSGFPLLLRRLGLDPAVASTPFIASFVDVLGLVVYFELARLILF